MSLYQFRSPLVRLSALSLLAVLSACSTVKTTSAPDQASSSTAAKSSVLYSWVVLGENGQAVARSVTQDAVCPSMIIDGTTQIMQVRAAAGTVTQRVTASSAEDSKPSDFPILTCEATLSPAIKSASIAGQNLPLPKAAPQKIIVIGDTGCRMKKTDNYYQPCNDVSKWAFHDVIKTAATFKPDLVIHVGDYHYRENRCPDGNADCAGSPWGYGWDTWNADFFAPAAPLLRVAPWVFVRGNHESCVRAGQGWWRLMDPRPLLVGRDCNLPQDDLSGDYSAPYGVPLGKIGTDDAQLIVFDSAKVPNKVLAKTDPAYALYMNQFNQVEQLSKQASFNIFVDHHPILGFAPEKKKGGAIDFKPGNAALQDLMQNIHFARLFPDNVQAVLSGHVHLFEAITFKTDHPTQFVTGNGGSSLDIPMPNVRPATATPFMGAEVDYFSNTNDVGFMTMEREVQGWKMQAWNKDGKLMTNCLLKNGKTTCEAAAQ
ncbi:metallophosphoesterase [Undibacterium sp. 5I1]|uniref:metallophosphoesterase family protein n=1 Tax=unclassified Undibacterium TaxID=2630295 RepID=UPI002AB50E93|nr:MULTISPECIES: metallophosphoesterase [unclassified Undibacterium]MDY7539438.1 metallophosphoesterase [Undibacterium sp. 5I1]MEB0231385.1 metallophosphoesterase [Undibacterium sp. 10I3]MEB0258385.1 metallophosphoesterase [Undibacterium sp. 5I1]